MTSFAFSDFDRKLTEQRQARSHSLASVLGLSAGALGWANMAQASSEDAGLKTILPKEFYTLHDDGSAIIGLSTGGQLSLAQDQYVILDDGLLLIVDELAQNALVQLPVMGALRTEMSSETQQPVRSPDGGVVEASDAQPLWSGDGDAPRLFTEVDIRRFELASHESSASGDHPDGWHPAEGGMILGGLLAAVSLFSNTPQATEEGETDTETGSSAAPALPDISSAGPIWMDSKVPDSGDFSIIGGAGAAWIGYTEPTAGSTDAITDLAKDSSATIDMSASGPTLLEADPEAVRNGSLVYTGGSQADTLNFPGIMGTNGSVTFDMSEGGTNTVSLGVAVSSGGSLSYTGGNGPDTVSTGSGSGVNGGTMSFNMSAGGDNVLNIGNGNAPDSFTYVGGPNTDTLDFGDGFSNFETMVVVLDMTNGGDNTVTFLGGPYSTFTYLGGSGIDKIINNGSFLSSGGTSRIELGPGADELNTYNNFEPNGANTYTIDLGDDTDIDVIEMPDSVNPTGSINQVVIKYFVPGTDTILLGLPTATADVTLTQNGDDIEVTAANINFTIEDAVATNTTLSLVSGDVLIS